MFYSGLEVRPYILPLNLRISVESEEDLFSRYGCFPVWKLQLRERFLSFCRKLLIVGVGENVGWLLTRGAEGKKRETNDLNGKSDRNRAFFCNFAPLHAKY